MTRAQAVQRVEDARRAHHAGLDAREKNHSVETAIAVCVAQQRFEAAWRSLARADFF